MYALLGPTGLRLMTPTVVYVELLAAPVTLIGSYLGNRNIVLSAIGIICSLHAGISLTVRNTFLLSSVACCAWTVFLPPMMESVNQTVEKSVETKHKSTSFPWIKSFLSAFIILSIISGSLWFEIISEECNQSMKHVWSTLLHNRWNVFIGAEE